MAVHTHNRGDLSEYGGVVESEGETEARELIIRWLIRFLENAVQIVHLCEAGHDEEGAVMEGNVGLFETAFVTKSESSLRTNRHADNWRFVHEFCLRVAVPTDAAILVNVEIGHTVVEFPTLHNLQPLFYSPFQRMDKCWKFPGDIFRVTENIFPTSGLGPLRNLPTSGVHASPMVSTSLFVSI